MTKQVKKKVDKKNLIVYVLNIQKTWWDQLRNLP